MPAGAVEIADVTGADDFKDIVLQVRGRIDPGDEFSIRFMVQDSNNYYLFKMRSDNQTLELFKVVGGVPTSLAAPVPGEIFNQTFYVLSVITDFNTTTSETLIKCFHDSNEVFNLLDPTFEKGTWGVEAGSAVGTEIRLSEIEMFLLPLEFDIIEPNQVI